MMKSKWKRDKTYKESDEIYAIDENNDDNERPMKRRKTEISIQTNKLKTASEIEEALNSPNNETLTPNETKSPKMMTKKLS